MGEIKIRYVWRSSDGKIYTEIVPIECLEGKGDIPKVVIFGNGNWKIIARNLYIGRTDKNGVEIYDGDIVKFYTQYFKKGTISKVVWDNQGMWFPFCDSYYTEDEQGDWFDESKGFEVIGNAYQHPELLTQAK